MRTQRRLSASLTSDGRTRGPARPVAAAPAPSGERRSVDAHFRASHAPHVAFRSSPRRSPARGDDTRSGKRYTDSVLSSDARLEIASATDPGALAWLAGGGEMRGLMREVDWSRTPVGAPEGWPQSLRTVVALTLESKFGMMVAWGPELTVFYNDAFRPILGQSKHPALGRGTRETFEEAWHIVGPLFEAVLAGEAVAFEDMLVPLDRNGFLEECYFQYCYAPIRDESGRVGGIHVTVNETSSRVLAERRLSLLRDLGQRTAGASSEPDVWRAAAEVLASNPLDAPFAFQYRVEPGGERARLVAAPKSAWAPSSVPLGRDEPGSWPLDPRLRPGAPTHLRDMATRFEHPPASSWGEAVTEALVLPVTRPGLDLPYGFLVAGVSPRLGLGRQYRDFFAQIADVIGAAVASARAHADERQRASLLEELRLADRRKDEFLATLAHELRNPMAAISTALSLLDSAELDERKAPRYMAAARRQVNHLVRLVDDLLDVARITRGKIELRKEALELAALIEHATQTVRPAIEARRHTLLVQVEPPTLQLYADATRIEQIIVNLLTNAAKYSEPGSDISVHAGLEPGGVRAGERAHEHVVIRVRDGGRGIPRHMLGKVFDLFTQVSPSIDRGTGGLGLGLTLVKHLAEKHGGSVAARSDGPGHGSEFIIRLPSMTHSKPDSSDPSSHAPKGKEPSRPARYRVLVVEDSEDVRELLAECVRSLGHEVHVAADGIEGATCCASVGPDIALLDVGLPGIDGYELARRIRAQPGGASVHLVALTGYGGAEVKREAERAGFDLQLTKPIDIQGLIRLFASVEAARRT
jgi:signal transduction histidine kinase/ActR/RegA family two-component response regulator/PAS domain-containing protein